MLRDVIDPISPPTIAITFGIIGVASFIVSAPYIMDGIASIDAKSVSPITPIADPTNMSWFSVLNSRVINPCRFL